MSKAELVLRIACETGEGPVWDGQSQILWWTDIPGKTLHQCQADGSGHKSFAMPGRVGCIGLRQQGGLVLAMEHGFYLWDPETGEIEALAEPEKNLDAHRFNDGRCDREGRFVAGSMNLATKAPTGMLWRLDADGAAHKLANECSIANGLAFSPEGRVMYWADTISNQVFMFDYDAEGRASNRRLWLDRDIAPGGADGAAIDAEGCYWSARWGGNCVVRVTPEGKVDRTISVPASQVSMCSFGGPDMKTLYITTAWEGMSAEQRQAEELAGSIFAVALDVAGIPEARFPR